MDVQGGTSGNGKWEKGSEVYCEYQDWYCPRESVSKTEVIWKLMDCKTLTKLSFCKGNIFGLLKGTPIFLLT